MLRCCSDDCINPLFLCDKSCERWDPQPGTGGVLVQRKKEEESIKPTRVIGFEKVGWRMDHPRGY